MDNKKEGKKIRRRKSTEVKQKEKEVRYITYNPHVTSATRNKNLYEDEPESKCVLE